METGEAHGAFDDAEDRFDGLLASGVKGFYWVLLQSGLHVRAPWFGGPARPPGWRFWPEVIRAPIHGTADGDEGTLFLIFFRCLCRLHGPIRCARPFASDWTVKEDGMHIFSTSDLSRKSGNIIASTLQGPVSINQPGKPGLIMLSVEQYEAWVSGASERATDATTEMPQNLAHDVPDAIDGCPLETNTEP